MPRRASFILQVLLPLALLSSSIYYLLNRLHPTPSTLAPCPPSPQPSSSLSSTADIEKKIWQLAPSCKFLARVPLDEDVVAAAGQAGSGHDADVVKMWERVGSWWRGGGEDGWRYECLSDRGGEEWVRGVFGIVEREEEKEREDVIVGPTGKGSGGLEELRWVGEVYLALSDRILKADLLRYLVVYVEGGLYTDLDTSCLHPISSWVDSSLFANASVLLGIESDRQPVENDWKLYSDYRTYIWGVANWTFAARKGHPLMRQVVEEAGKRIMALAEKQGGASAGGGKGKGVRRKKLGDMTVRYSDVIETTGPRAFSDAVLAYVMQAQGQEVKSHETFSMLEEPKLVGDVLVLPIRAFSQIEANRVDGGARSLEFEELVRHWSESTWKKDHLIDDREDKKRPEGWKEIKREGSLD